MFVPLHASTYTGRSLTNLTKFIYRNIYNDKKKNDATRHPATEIRDQAEFPRSMKSAQSPHLNGSHRRLKHAAELNKENDVYIRRNSPYEKKIIRVAAVETGQRPNEGPKTNFTAPISASKTMAAVKANRQPCKGAHEVNF
jgi:hypothetical protein